MREFDRELPDELGLAGTIRRERRARIAYLRG